MLGLVITTGLIDSFNPCAIGVFLFYLAVLINLGASRKAIYFGIFYIIAVYFSYLLIGLGILRAAHLFGVHNFFGWVAASLLIIFGAAHLVSYFSPLTNIPVIGPIINRCRVPRWNTELTIGAALILGILVGICEFPCSGGLYLGTIALLAAKQTFWQGLGYLLIYNLMFILPLVIIFAMVANRYSIKVVQGWQASKIRVIKLVNGAVMIILGLVILIWLINQVR